MFCFYPQNSWKISGQRGRGCEQITAVAIYLVNRFERGQKGIFSFF